MAKFILISMVHSAGIYTGRVQSSKGGPLLTYRGKDDEWYKQGDNETPNKKILKCLKAGQFAYEGTGLPIPEADYTEEEIENAKKAIPPKEKKLVKDILEEKRQKRNIPVVDTGKGIRVDKEEIAKEQKSFAERMAEMRARTKGKRGG